MEYQFKYLEQTERLYCGYSDGQVRVFDMTTSQCVTTLQIDLNKCIWQIQKTGKCEMMVGSSSGKLFVISSGLIDNLTQTISCSKGEILSICRSKNDQVIYFSGNDSNIFALAKNLSSDKYTLLGKLRGQSHSVQSLFCVYSDWNNSDQMAKLLSGGETSDICVMDIAAQGFQKADKKNGITEKSGFRHVLEPLHQRLQSGYSSKGVFLRRDLGFIELVQTAKTVQQMHSLFSLEHSKPISCVAFCEVTSHIAYYNSEDLELSVVNFKTGQKIFKLQKICLSALKFLRSYLVYFDCLNAKLVYLKKHHNFKEDLACAKIMDEDDLYIDSIQTDLKERFMLLTDNLNQKSKLLNTQTNEIRDVSEIWQKNSVLKLIQLHPVESRIYYINNANNLFYYSLKEATTHPVVFKSTKIPSNLQINSIIFCLFNCHSIKLISDYDIVHINLLKKNFRIEHKTHRLINMISVVNVKSNIKLYILLYILDVLEFL